MGSEFSDWFQNVGIPKYTEAKQLSEITSKDDPEKEPFKSKYKARDSLVELRSLMNDFLQDYQINESGNEWDDSVHSRDKAEHDHIVTVAAFLDYEIGLLNIETEEIARGEEHLTSCLELLHGKELEVGNISLVVASNNQLGILWCNRGEHKKAYGFLHKGEQLYLKYKKCQDIGPIHFKAILDPTEESSSSTYKQKEFENLHTHTLYYLAQVFTRLGQSSKAAKYCHVTLARQMETKQYDPADWALNCATLSQYYLCKDNYEIARHCLACSSRVYAEALEKFDLESCPEEEKERKREKIYRGQADVSRCWLKYCLNLLKHSHSVKMGTVNSSPNSDSEGTNGNGNDDTCELQAGFGDLDIDAEFSEISVDACYEKQLVFDTLEVASIEEDVTEKAVDSFEQAKGLFISGQKWMARAKEFYQLDGYVTDHVEILQDYSQLLKYLAFFENDFERRCKMHKKRVDTLNPVLAELNPQHFLLICRQLTFEIGEIYGEIADLKRAMIEEDASQLSVDSIRRINKLLLQGIKYFESFVSSYKQKEQMPETFDDDAVRGVLLAYFYMARYYGKYLTPDKTSKAANLKKEKEKFQFIVDYCESHPNMPPVFEEELRVSREILALFPTKMNQLLDSS